MVRQFSPPTSEQEEVIRSYQARGAQLTRITETVSMLSADGVDPVLVSVKAADPNVYPFYGAVKLEPPMRLPNALTPDTIAISDDLVARLDLKLGARLRLGSADFRTSATVRTEPDRMSIGRRQSDPWRSGAAPRSASNHNDRFHRSSCSRSARTWAPFRGPRFPHRSSHFG